MIDNVIIQTEGGQADVDMTAELMRTHTHTHIKHTQEFTVTVFLFKQDFFLV